jgi:hypothetical protein
MGWKDAVDAPLSLRGFRIPAGWRPLQWKTVLPVQQMSDVFSSETTPAILSSGTVMKTTSPSRAVSAVFTEGCPWPMMRVLSLAEARLEQEADVIVYPFFFRAYPMEVPTFPAPIIAIFFIFS